MKECVLPCFNSYLRAFLSVANQNESLRPNCQIFRNIGSGSRKYFTRRVGRVHCGIWLPKVNVIQEIVRLCPELQPQTFSNSKFFKDREIRFPKVGAIENIAANVADCSLLRPLPWLHNFGHSLSILRNRRHTIRLDRDWRLASFQPRSLDTRPRHLHRYRNLYNQE